MNALVFLVETLMNLALFVVLLRLLLQWARADFRNPISQAVVQLTNPLVMPLRRVLPPVGKVDTASVVAVVLVALLEVAAIYAMREFEFGLPPPIVWPRSRCAKKSAAFAACS